MTEGTAKAVFTIGYGGRRFADFIRLLQQHDIALVVDVRRFPGSKVSEYRRGNLEAELSRLGIEYVWMGDMLGGLRREGYVQYMQSSDYQEGIERLAKLARQKNLAILCKERTDAGCHRRHIVASLVQKGVNVIALV
jgi:uncharacterized protein (DUF488 family)